MTRRLLSVAAFAMAIGLFAGCGESSTNSTEPTRPDMKIGKNKEKGMPAPPPIQPATK
ncbi:MAG: hypothetical protein U0798_03540 [Gemmataceae bacterium]